MNFYTKAIEIKEHEIYFSNRTYSHHLTRIIGALVYIYLENPVKAIEDCDKALQINNKWTKAYLRKAIALTFEPMDEKNYKETTEVI